MAGTRGSAAPVRDYGGSALNFEDAVQAIRRRWRLVAGIFLIACVAVGVFVFLRTNTKTPIRYRSIAKVDVGNPAPKTENKSPSGKKTTATTVPSITLSRPQRLALAKTTIDATLRAAHLPTNSRIAFAAKIDRQSGALNLQVTTATRTQATVVATNWAKVFKDVSNQESNRRFQATRRSLGVRIRALHSELETIDFRLAKLMPIVYSGLLRYDASSGNVDPNGKSTSSLPPVPELGGTTSTYALNLAYERQQLQGMISDISQKFAKMNIQTNATPNTLGKLVSQTPSKRLTHKQQTTIPALGGLFLGLLVALAAALLVDRTDRTIRDPATAAAAFSAPVLSLIPVNGDGQFAVLAHPSSITADAYRGLAATSIATDRLPKAIMVSTPHGDTHAPVAANYAAALSRLGLNVALVATSPEQAWYMESFTLPESGRTTLPELLALAHDGVVNGQIRARLATTDKAPNLVVVPPSDKPAAHMRVDGLPPLLQALSDSGIDVTVISGPALLEEADATIVAWATRSVLWAIEPGEVTEVEARAAAARLDLAGVTPFGVVMVEHRQRRSGHGNGNGHSG